SLVGRPLMVNRNTEERGGLNFARILVEVELGAQLPEVVHFKNERGQLIEQTVQYDWKSTLCKYCKIYGHSEKVWRLNKKIPRDGQVKQGTQRMKWVLQQTVETTMRYQSSGEVTPRNHNNVGKEKGKQSEKGGTSNQGWQVPVRIERTPRLTSLRHNQQVNVNSFQILQRKEANSKISGNVGGLAIPALGNG
ncbi:hypothetical protein EJD97_015355, partial [Solanum chilense]